MYMLFISKISSFDVFGMSESSLHGVSLMDPTAIRLVGSEWAKALRNLGY